MKNKRSNTELINLPHALIDGLTRNFGKFFGIETAAGAILLFFTLLALVIANSPFSKPYLEIWETVASFQVGPLKVTRTLSEWINDGLMTFFFFLGALELKRQLIFGDLKNPKLAALSVAGAIGGMVFPAVVFLFLQYGSLGQNGWGAVMATDTAFVIGCLALLGKRIPRSMKVFMLSLAIVDDIGAILVVAVGYSNHLDWAVLGYALLGIATIRGMAMIGIRSFPPYFIVGSFIWLLIDISGIHATVTGVILGLMTPARRWVSDKRLYAILNQVVSHPTAEEGVGKTKNRDTVLKAAVAARETLSPLERLEISLHPWVGFLIMPIFALANAGINISMDYLAASITWAVFFGFVVGKPIGVVLISWLAFRSGLAALPSDMNWKLIIGGGMLSGIGFTMSLFISNLAFSPEIIDSAKLGILLASTYSAVVGLAWLFYTTRGINDGS